jgi:hypothetical protein
MVPSFALSAVTWRWDGELGWSPDITRSHAETSRSHPWERRSPQRLRVKDEK